MDLIAVKVAGASVVALLVALQALIMLQLYRRRRVFAVSADALMAWHRCQGYVLLALVLAIAYECVTNMMVNWHDPRVVLHAGAATVLVAVLLAKILSVRAFPRIRGAAPALGVLLVLAAVVTVGTTVPWYAFMWLVRGARPLY